MSKDRFTDIYIYIDGSGSESFGPMNSPWKETIFTEDDEKNAGEIEGEEAHVRIDLEAGLQESSGDLLERILSCLPMMSMYRSREVNKEWDAIISSQRFLRQLWPDRKPVERWLYLSNDMNEVLLYNLRDKECYEWGDTAKESYATFRQLASTSASGLVFAYGYESGGLRVTICAFNPITGEFRRVPAMVNDMIWVLTMTAIGSYKLLVTGLALDKLAESDSQLWTELYDSSDGTWRVVADESKFVHPVSVERFNSDDGMVCFMDKFSLDGFRSRQHVADGMDMDPARGSNWKLARYCTRKHRWSHCLLEAWGDDWQRVSSGHMLLERNGFMVLFVIEREQRSWDCVRAHVLSKPIPPRPCNSRLVSGSTSDSHQSPWTLLASMPDVMFQRFHARECWREARSLETETAADSSAGAPSRRLLGERHGHGFTQHQRRWSLEYHVSHCKSRIKVRAAADEVHGDRLVFFNAGSLETVFFHFDSPPDRAWTSSLFSTIPLCDCNASARRSDVAKLMRLTGSESADCFSFEPRPDVIP